MHADVLVVGAGPTGLTTAAELARHGVVPRIVDRASAPSEKSKAFVVHARTLELFENMGMVRPILDVGRPASGIAFYDHGQQVASIPIAGKIASKYPFVQIISQRDTERILLEHLRSFGVEVERQVELVELGSEHDHVAATLRHADGHLERMTCSWLVGNDGAHSTVRKQLGLRFEGAPYPSQWLLADIDLEWPLPYDELSVFFHGTGTTAFFPLAGRRGRLMFEVPAVPVDEPQPEPTIDDVCRLAGERNVPFESITNPSWLAWFRLHHRIVDAYAVDRSFLGGDAAHIHSPVGGQGMNMGIQDAYNLAWKLALVVRGKAAPQLLASYHAERHRRDREIVGLTHRATTMATIHNPVLAAIRKLALGVVSRFEGIQARIACTLAQIELHYRDSPIVREAWKRPRVPGFAPEGELRAGERVPDFPLRRADGGGDIVLYDLLTGAEHELLLFAGAEPEPEGLATLRRIATNVAARLGELVEVHLILPEDAPSGGPDLPSTHVDPQLGMHRAFGAATASVVLVRPDGYIAFRNQPADPVALGTYLDSIFTSASP